MKNSISYFARKARNFCFDKSRLLKRDDSGMAAIEMAFIFPVMVIMLVGLVDVTDGMSANRKVTITANTLGDLISQEPGTTTESSIDGIFSAAVETMVPYDGSSVGLEIFTFRKTGGNDPQLEWQHTQGPSCGAVPGVTADMDDLMAQGNDLIISRTCYNFSYILGTLFSGNTSFQMKDEMTLRPRKSLQLDCSDCS
ncbi:hypothetical protein MNBD_ALPHA08-1775 [hydrothermal vent metagenome]|uniref:TadE-like domain-containing protein n=1 Tax=hydrothermal vent metagenome TaxID=652676 RepID=A0A3B0SGW6_9ZZZZ